MREESWDGRRGEGSWARVIGMLQHLKIKAITPKFPICQDCEVISNGVMIRLNELKTL